MVKKPIFSPEDGPLLIKRGRPMVKKPNPVYMLEMLEDFEVETNEGLMQGHAGDSLAHDPISGHVWPVSGAYVAMHYNPAPERHQTRKSPHSQGVRG
jgi:hypothetical protein